MPTANDAYRIMWNQTNLITEDQLNCLIGAIPKATMYILDIMGIY